MFRPEWKLGFRYEQTFRGEASSNPINVDGSTHSSPNLARHGNRTITCPLWLVSAANDSSGTAAFDIAGAAFGAAPPAPIRQPSPVADRDPGARVSDQI